MGDVNHEPSMEEILASIKRVIAEDNRAMPPRGRRVSLPPEPEPEEDILELSDPVRDDDADRLMSSATAASSRTSLAALAALQQAAETPEPAAVAGEGPLEAVVKEMLRPMLKSWLDQHLPEIVEQLVAREVARITGKSI